MSRVVKKHIEYRLLVVTVLLMLIGLLMVYSVSYHKAEREFQNPNHMLYRQMVWLLVGLLVGALVVALPDPLYLVPRVVGLVMGGTVLLLIMVLFTGQVNGSSRWLRLGGASLQPSEFAKIAIVMYMSWLICHLKDNINDLRKLFVLISPVALALLLILMEPDYGTFSLMSAVCGFMLYVGGLRLRYFLTAVLGVGGLGTILVLNNAVRYQRILAFLDPEKHSQTTGFQLLQSIYAVGSGGIWGKMLSGQVGGSMQKLDYLPYASTDFIYAIIGEEFGLLGCLLVLCLFFAFFMFSATVARRSDNPQVYLLVLGLSLTVLLQALINISVTLGLLPTKGIALPFISTGGSSLLTSTLVAALILNVSRLRQTVLHHDSIQQN